MLKTLLTDATPQDWFRRVLGQERLKVDDKKSSTAEQMLTNYVPMQILLGLGEIFIWLCKPLDAARS